MEPLEAAVAARVVRLAGVFFSGLQSPLKWVDPRGSQVSSRARRSRVLARLPVKMQDSGQ